MAHTALFEPLSVFAPIAALPPTALPLARGMMGPAQKPLHVESELLQTAGKEFIHFLLVDPIAQPVEPGSTQAPDLSGLSGWLDSFDSGISRALVIRSGPSLWPADSADPTHSLSWLPASRQRFDAFCTALEQALQRRLTASTHPLQLLLWPHANGVISDAPSLHTFLRARPAWGFLFDPAALLTPAMLPSVDDHLARLFDAFSAHPRAAAAVRSDDSMVAAHHWAKCTLTQLTFIPAPK